MIESHNFSELDSLFSQMGDKTLRITIIDLKGQVLYDTEVDDPAGMENHLQRPEIQDALQLETGKLDRINILGG